MLSSIITQTINPALLLPRAIKSASVETQNDWELLIVDDASTDDTQSVVELFRDNRIRYLPLPRNAGPRRRGTMEQERRPGIVSRSWTVTIRSFRHSYHKPTRRWTRQIRMSASHGLGRSAFRRPSQTASTESAFPEPSGFRATPRQKQPISRVLDGTQFGVPDTP